MPSDLREAAAALLAAATRIDRADYGRTVLVPREHVERLRTALEREGHDAPPGPPRAAAGENGETP